ncbi:MAG: hypothetical protein J7K39_04830 [Bacteroidales bacterium]|nr:hypothetical protein [Bacteroidales bacterium]
MLKLNFLGFKLFLYGLFFTLMFSSCDIDEPSDPWLVFYPRECNYVFARNYERITWDYDNRIIYEYHQAWNTDVFTIDKFVLDVFTSNINLDSVFLLENGNEIIYNSVDEPLPQLESELESSYNRSRLKAGEISQSDEENDTPIDIEYRLTGIKSFQISALDKELFNIAAGSSLNVYFDIVKYEPDFIASSVSKRLLYGFGDTEKPKRIDEWLSLSPLAQNSMLLRLNSNPENLPLSVQFVIALETEEGIILRDTTSLITLENE